VRLRRRIALGVLLAGCGCGAVSAFGPFRDEPSGPRALPGDLLPPFGMKQADGQVPGPPPLPPGASLPQPHGPPESTAPGPSMVQAAHMATAAIRACAVRGYRVGASVVDSAGQARAMLSADGADGSHVFVAMRKAEVAVTFGRSSAQVAEAVARDPAMLSRVTQAMFVEGGAVPILRGGRVVGALGVSGAAGMPIGRQDELCALSGVRG
jgi:uncharacterized protein GlcG (DUF336 family)